MNLSIDFPQDPKIGYLSYKHISPFEINGEIWPSIYRYILSRTILNQSEKIRTSPSESSIRRLVKTRTKTEVRSDGMVIKKVIEGCETVPINFDLELEEAFESKFNPMMEEFLKTYPFPLVSKLEPEYAASLTKFRDKKYLEKVRSERAKIDLTTDLPSLDNVDRLFKILGRYVKKLKKIEKVKKDHLGLYDDALWNLAPHGKIEKILTSIKIDYVMRNLSNQREVISRCYDFFGKRFPKQINTSAFKKIADTAWATFRWQIFSGMKYNLKLKSTELKLKPVSRPYRKKEAKAGHLKSLVVRSEEYAKLFGHREDYEVLVEAYEKMQPMKRELEIEKLLLEYDQNQKKEEETIKLPEKVKDDQNEDLGSILDSRTESEESQDIPVDDLEDDSTSVDRPSDDSTSVDRPLDDSNSVSSLASASDASDEAEEDGEDPLDDEVVED